MRGRGGAGIVCLPVAGIAFAALIAGCREPQLRPIPHPPEVVGSEGGTWPEAPPPPGAEPTEIPSPSRTRRDDAGAIPPPPAPSRGEVRLPSWWSARREPAQPTPSSSPAPAPWLREPRSLSSPRPAVVRPEGSEPSRVILPPVHVEQEIVAGVQYPIGTGGLFAGLSFSFDTRPELDPATGEMLRRLRLHVLNDSGIEVRDLQSTVRIGWLSFAHRGRHFPPRAIQFFADAAEIRFPAIPSYPSVDPGRTASFYLSVPREAAPVRIAFSRGTSRSRTFVALIPGAPGPGLEDRGP
ncbi:MAG: hypothetical protein JXP34_28070 [Planctomycetes bacterium]|nr:hypothetical protein [Planctomycetota bacterium]